MCSVVRCDSWRRNARRFVLPEDSEKRVDWVQFLFEVNDQKLKESSWTDITICSEHFTLDCFLNNTKELKSGAVPSVYVKDEPDESQEQMETTDFPLNCEHLKTPPSSPSGVPSSPTPNDVSDDSMFDYSLILKKIENLDSIRKKACLLQMKNRYVVNEKQILQMFSSRCPMCRSKLKAEKVVCGVLLTLNLQCLECDYSKQWKNLNTELFSEVCTETEMDQYIADAAASSPENISALAYQMLSTGDDQSSNTGRPEIVHLSDEESDESEESSSNSDEMGSDEDWDPEDEFSFFEELHSESQGESVDGECFDKDEDVSKHRELCPDCGKLVDKQRTHTCEHKIKPYSCNHCGKRFTSEESLKRHGLIHDGTYEFRCKCCHVRFKTKVDKVSHEQSHLTEEKPFRCSQCSETFATFMDCRHHLVGVHRGPRHRKCHICGMEFPRYAGLERHMIVHTGEKPFSCPVCHRGFKQASHLKSHVRVHTGEKPYQCKHCHKCFNHNVSLKSHIQRYHKHSSGRKRKTRAKKRDNGDAQANEAVTYSPGVMGDERDTDDDDVQMEKSHRPKSKWKSSGRPKGRPKRGAAKTEETEGQGSKTKRAKVEVLKSKRKRSNK